MLGETVLAYLLRANRPKSCKDVTVMLGGVYTKQDIQKALDALTENGRIQCEILENQHVVYVAKMNVRTEVDDDVIEAMIDFDARARSYKNSNRNESIALRIATNRLKTIMAGPPTASAYAKMTELNNFMTPSIDKLERLMYALNNITTYTLSQIIQQM